MRKLLRRPSPAMIVACLALLVALGGTSVAAVSQLARNSVGAPQLQTGAVTNPKLRNNAVNSAKVRSAVASALGLRCRSASGRPGRAAGTGRSGGSGRCRGSGGRHRRDHACGRSRSASPTVQSTARWNSQRVRSDCEGNERAISGGTSWGDDGADLRARHAGARAEAERAESGRRLRGCGRERHRRVEHLHGATSLCYTP